MNRFIQKALCAVAACALTLSLSACGSTSPATGAASAGVPTVTIWGYGGQEVREALQAVADAHNADPAYNTKARVEIQFVVSGTSEQSLPDRLAAAYQAGETDTDFDIIALDDSGISAILAQTSEDFFIPIDTSKIPNYENVVFKDNIVGDTFIPYRGWPTIPKPWKIRLKRRTSCINGSRTIPAVSPTATRPPAAPAIPL